MRFDIENSERKQLQLVHTPEVSNKYKTAMVTLKATDKLSLYL